MPKTKNISLRLDEDDLKLAFEKSGFKKPQKLIDFLLSEYVRQFKSIFIPQPNGGSIQTKTNWLDEFKKQEKPIVSVPILGKPVTIKITKENYMTPADLSEMEKQFQEELSKIKNKK